MKNQLAAVACTVCMWPGVAAAQTVTCAPKESRSSLVRIDRPGGVQGTGVVIVRRDKYAIVLTVKHVMPSRQNFSIVFQVDPGSPVAVRWTQDMLLAVPDDSDLIAFRIDAPIPKDVVPEDPFMRDVPEGSTVVLWGYPSATGATLCSYEAKLMATDSGHLTIGSFVPEGVSGGPAFFIDPEDGSPKLAGIVVSGTGNVKSGTTDAIDIRQAVPIVTTSKDVRNGNKPHPWPNIQLADEFVADTLLSFRRVKAGSFEMGSESVGDQRRQDGKPGPMNPTLSNFYMGKYEVTRAQYEECVAEGPCTYTKPNSSPKPAEANLPVVNVTWYDAGTFAKWLQQRLMARPDTPRDLQRLLDAGWRIDLPSEDEWEKAARKDGKGSFPWGDRPNQPDANYNTGRLRPVDASKCNECEWGLFDMAGNAREWTRSLKLPYPYEAAKAEKPDAPGKRAIRGGSYKEQPNAVLARQTVRAANREEEAPNSADQFTGFRVALICKNEGERPCHWQNPD